MAVKNINVDLIINGSITLSNNTDRQTTINDITQVSSATNEYVLTKDTATGNAMWKEVSGSTDSAAIHDNVASEISAITEKTSIADNDIFLIEDSANSNNKKKIKRSSFLGSISPYDIWTGSQSSYDAIGTPDSNTLYFITS